MKLRRTLIRAAAALLAAATSVMAAAADKDDFEQHAARIRAGPESAPLSNDTGFSKGLRCMDGLFRAYGVRNVTVVIDQIPDQTKKISVGARDMFMSATAQMTRTSHAVRLVPIVESRVFNDAKRERVVADADFAIQGSISQFDDSMLKKQRDGAVCIWHLCVGAADSDKIAGLGLDLNLVETAGMSMVPGASVKNAVLIRTHGNGYDGDLILRKFSVEFNFTLVSNEGNGQALRTLIELGAIELYGRMLKLPYWSCLGASDQDPAVSSEIDDWWEEMAADPHDSARLLGYLQLQMKAQGLYDEGSYGRGGPALLRAVRAYLMALGLSDDLNNLDARFLHKYLAADHIQVRKIAAIKLQEIAQKEGPLPPEPVAQAASPSAPTTQTAMAPSAPGTQGGPAVGRAATSPVAAAPATAAPSTGAAASAAASASASAARPAVAPSVASVPPAAVASAGTTRPVAPAPVAPAQPVAPAPVASNQPVAPPPVAAAQPVAPAPVASNQPVAPAPVASNQPVAPPPVARARPVAAASATQSPSAALTPVVYRPAPIPIEGSRPANNAAYRAGEPFYVGVISPRDGYLYCYLVDDRQRVSQFYPEPSQAPARVSGGTLTVVNSESPLLAARPERKEKVACFSSPKDLGQQPLDADSIAGLDGLKSRFAIAVSGAYAMGVFDVKVQ